MVRWILLGTFCWWMSSSLLAQSPSSADSTLWIIEMEDGNRFLGQILAENAEVINLETKVYGILELPLYAVRSREEVTVEQLIGGEVWLNNPQAARYFWVPNGYGLKKGEGYYQNVWVLYNQASFGLSDNFSLGVGLVPLFFFGGTASPMFITPKFSFPVVENKVNAGVGLLGGALIGEDATFFGIAYGTTTFGNRNKNLNLGFGWAFADGEWAERPTFSVAGMVRLSEKFYLLSENYFINIGPNDNLLVLSFGGRVLNQRWGLDFGLVAPTGLADIFLLIPWLGFTIPINGN